MVKRLKKAFTITELVIVIAVIGILVAVLIPTFSNVISSAKQSAALQTCSNALKDYQIIAQSDDDPDNDDMLGMVFVSDSHAFVYINSSLHFLGKLNELDKATGTDLTFTSVPAISGFNFSGIEANTGYTSLTMTFSTTEGTPVGEPAEIAKADLGEVAATETAAKKLAENIYFYTIEVNGSAYCGYFSIEEVASSSNETGRFYTQGANYSHYQGIAVVDSMKITVTGA